MCERLSSVALFMSFIGVILVSGCASTGTIQLHDSVTVRLSRFESMVLDVTSDVPNSSREVAQLESEIMSRLRTKGLFERVLPRVASGDEKHDLIVLVTIKQLRRVSHESRIMVGALAGKGKIVADIQLRDASSNAVIGQATAVGKTSGGTAFAGTTSQAVSKIAGEVVKLLEQNM